MKFFSLVHKDARIHLSGKKKVVPAEEFSRLLEAISIIEEAKEDTKKMLNQNKEECAEKIKEAEEAGFNEGLSRFNQQALYFEQEAKRMRHELQEMVLPLALKAAKKIVGTELQINPGAIVDIVIQTLKPVSQSKQIRIFVNKADRDALEKEKAKLREGLEQVQSIIVEERTDVTPGGCIIETEAGIINASLENQWRALEAAFERFMKR